MADFDRGFKFVTRFAGRQLANLAGLPVDSWRPITSEVQTTERIADRAFSARSAGGERFIVYMEAYTYWNANAPWNMLAKAGLLSEREHRPTACVVFILKPQRYMPQDGTPELTVGGEVTQLLTFREMCLWQMTPTHWWEESPGLMTLYPLSHHEREPADAVRYAARVIERRTRDTIRRADLLTVLSIFGRLAYRPLDTIALIGREKMRESLAYHQILDEGRLESRRADTLAAVEVRFGSEAATQVAAAVNALEDLPQLDQLLRLAIGCAAINEFHEALAAAAQPARRARGSSRRRPSS